VRKNSVFKLFTFLLTLASVASTCEATTITDIQRADSVDFQREILPILKNNCLACHNQTKAKAELNLETPQTILKGGESGPAVVPGKAAESLLLKVAAHLDDPHMPPKDNKVNASDLTPEELGLMKLWIEQGAKGEVRATETIPWRALPAGLNPIYAAALMPDGQFGACSRANQIFIYHVPSGQEVTRLTDTNLAAAYGEARRGVAHLDLVESLAFSPDGNLLASGSFREVKLWRRVPNVPKELPATNSSSMAVSPDARWIAIGSSNGAIRIHDGIELKAHEGAVTAMKFAPGGQILGSVGGDGFLRLWNVTNSVPLLETNLGSALFVVSWASSNRLATVGANDLIRIWDFSNGVLTQVKEIQAAVTCLEFSGPDRILTGNTDGSIQLRQIENGAVLKQMKHDGGVTAIAVRLDGKRFASAGTDNAIRLWNGEDGKEIAVLKGDRYAQELVASVERDLAFGNSEVTYCKATLEKAEKQKKTETERLAKVTETFTAAEKTFIEKQKALTEAGTTKTNAEKLLTELNAELKKITDQFNEAEKFSKQATAEAKTAVEKATQAKLIADQASQTKTEVEKVAADTAAVIAKTQAGDAKIRGEAEAIAAKAKAFAESVAADAAAKIKLALDLRTSADKAIEDVAARAYAAGQLKPAFDKTTAESPEKIKQAAAKVTESSNTVAKAEKEFQKAEVAKSNSEHEIMLVKTAVKQAEDAFARSESALKNAEQFKKAKETEFETAKAAAKQSEKPIRALAFSADNRVLASDGDDGAIHTWSAQNGLAYEVFKGQTGSLHSVAFAKDSLMAAGAAHLCSWGAIPQWTLERTIGTGDANSPLVNRVMALDFSPDGKQLATGGGEPTRGGEVKVWNVRDGKLLHAFTNVHSDAVFALDFSPDGKYLASGAADKFVRVVELASGKVTKAFEGHTHHVLGVSWKRDGRTLASAGADNVVKIWDFLSGERKKNIEGFGKEVTAISFIGGTDQAVIASGDTQVKLMKENGDSVRSFSGAKDFMHAAAATPDGKWIIAGGQDSVLRIWRGEETEAVRELPAPDR
jgi:WD40 repeat protein